MRTQENSKTPYSDKKRKAKYIPEYSVLKPETNSLSASLKSKGARWVSARVQMNQMGKRRSEKREDWAKRERIEKDIRINTNKTTRVLKTDS